MLITVSSSEKVADQSLRQKEEQMDVDINDTI